MTATRIRYDDGLHLTLSHRVIVIIVMLALHGPIDVGLTLLAPALEVNPVVSVLGLTAWATTKAVLLALIVFVEYDAPRQTPARYDHVLPWFRGIVIALGVFAVAGNLISLIVATHLGVL